MRFIIIILLTYAAIGYIEQNKPMADVEYVEQLTTSDLDRLIMKAEKCMETPGCKSIN